MAKKKSVVQRGYKAFRKEAHKTKGMLRVIRNCKTCTSFYGKTGEQCNNNNVTKYDITVEPDGRTYCTFWRPEGVE
jgi:hypothetical protein